MTSVKKLKKKTKTKVSIFVNKMLLLLFSCQVISNSFATPWTVVHQVPLSMGFPRKESWSGLPFPFPGDVPDLGIEPRSPALQADTLPSELPGKPTLMKVTYNHPVN